MLASFGGGAGTGDRLPLIVYKIYPEDGREEMVRGARIIGLNTRMLRNLGGIGNDDFVYNYMQSQESGFAGTALGAFGSARLGLPASLVAPSLLFDDLEVRGARGEPKRLPLLPAPSMTVVLSASSALTATGPFAIAAFTARNCCCGRLKICHGSFQCLWCSMTFTGSTRVRVNCWTA